MADQVVIDEKELTKIFSNIQSQINTAFGFVTSWVTDVSTNIKTMVMQITDQIITITSSVRKEVTNTLASFTSGLQNILRDIGNYIADTVQNARKLFEDMANRIAAFLQPIVDDIKAFISSAFTFVVGWIGNLVTDARQHLTDLTKTVADAVRPVINSAKDIVSSIGDGIKKFVEEVIGFAGDVVRDLVEIIARLPETVSNLGKQLAESAAENIGKPIRDLGDDVAKAISSAMAKAVQSDIMSGKGLIETLLSPNAAALKQVDGVMQLLNKDKSSNPFTWAAFEILSIPLLAFSVLSGVGSAQSQILLRDYAINNRYHQLTVADIVDSRRRGLIDEREYETKLAQHGVSDRDIKIYRDLGRTHLPVGDLVTLWLRDLLTDDDFVKSMSAQGYSQSDINRIMEGAFFIPPAQDLITMAVREVFSPQVAARFGQFEDFPPEFEKQAAKQGISSEWARNYWAAHWSLPSPQMGFEMLHRRIINKEDLILLLKSLDIMPFWRDRLIQLSYSPLTRVDIRRMFDLGVLSEAEVYSAYLDIGYDEKNAKRLADFTKLLSKSGGSEDAAQLKGLTRAKVVDLYKDGVLSRSQSLDMLKSLGNSADAAELYLIDADLDLDMQARKLEMQLITEQFKSGDIDLNGARSALLRAGFETVEVERALLKLQNANRAKAKIPSEETLAKMAKVKIITESEYLQALGSIGYSEAWAQRIVKLNRSA
jgi:hypothetical protein